MKRLTKSQYEVIARAMYGTHPRLWAYPALDYGSAQEQWQKTIERLAFLIGKADNQFNRQKFLADCGIENRYLADGTPGYYDANGSEVKIS